MATASALALPYQKALLCKHVYNYPLHRERERDCMRMIPKQIINRRLIKNHKPLRRIMKVVALYQDVDMDMPTSIDMEAINSEELFDNVLAQAQQRSQPILIDWMATWCRKCIYLKPKLEKLAAEFYPRVRFYYVNVNAVPQALVNRAGVVKMPTIQLWNDGKKQAEVIGGHSKAWLVIDEIREMIKDSLTSDQP